MYWDKILQNVVKKKNTQQKINIANLALLNQSLNIAEPRPSKLTHTGKPKCYSLGPKYHGAYFTRREAECMLLMLKGKTIAKIAITLGLSPRTIEFYLKNMKTKLGCRTKFELIEIVLESTFLQTIDFV